MPKPDYSKGLKIVKIRLVRDGVIGKDRYVTTPQEAVELLCEELSYYDREVFCVVNLRADLSVINMNVVSIGNATSSIVSAKEVYKSSILSNASGILLAHVHPSGRLTPSKEDYDVTKTLVACGKLLDIQVVDHVIVSAGPMQGYYSFKEHGELGLGAYEAKNKDSFER